MAKMAGATIPASNAHLEGRKKALAAVAEKPHGRVTVNADYGRKAAQRRGRVSAATVGVTRVKVLFTNVGSRWVAVA